MLWPTMEQKLGLRSQILGFYVVSVVGGYWDVWGLGGEGCGGALGGSLVLSVGASLLVLLGLLSGGGWLDVLRRAFQDGRGPQSASRSKSGVVGWRRQSTSWVQYFLFDALCIQLRREPYQSMCTVGMSKKRSCRFSTMHFFPVVCGRPFWRLWLQHAVIILQDGQSGGLRFILPKKFICCAAMNSLRTLSLCILCSCTFVMEIWRMRQML